MLLIPAIRVLHHAEVIPAAAAAAADEEAAMILSNAGLPRSSIGSRCGSMRTNPAGYVNWTTQFRVEAGAVSDPSG